VIRKIKIDGEKVRLVNGQGLAKVDNKIVIGLWVFLSQDLRCLRLMMVADATPLNKDLVSPVNVIEHISFLKASYY
jgi:hypothetical protein